MASEQARADRIARSLKRLGFRLVGRHQGGARQQPRFENLQTLIVQKPHPAGGKQYRVQHQRQGGLRQRVGHGGSDASILDCCSRTASSAARARVDIREIAAVVVSPGIAPDDLGMLAVVNALRVFGERDRVRPHSTGTTSKARVAPRERIDAPTHPSMPPHNSDDRNRGIP